MSNMLAAYKIKQTNLLKQAYRQNVSNLRSGLNNAITNYLSRKISLFIKRQLIQQAKQLFVKTLSVLTQTFNANITFILRLTQIPRPIPTPIPVPVPGPISIPISKPSKKALLIGINYNGTNNQLNGCINDVTDVGNYLIGKGFSINLITDITYLKPTKYTILAEFKNLLQNSTRGDVLYFMFSGHGNTQQDTNNDEASGKDQLIIPLDSIPIVDDDLKNIINQYLQTDVTLIALFDSCFSGTVLDLKYQYLDSLNYDEATIYDKESRTNGKVFMISGCTDKQTSEDAYINNKYNGALTWSYLEVLKNNSTIITWRKLVQTMRDNLKSNNYSQIPQFSCGQSTNIDEPISWF